ncbi:ABC transporter ATP-binding protein [uncultured Ilyobacter sp.]|uniref:ABC transporter ATP-binding protein n=1 Tax=uncultured Ilyobacter sp. TaxID=544433 RepID=UPI002AA6C8CF|nr:ABC transporter ATP-binding protein [uncultured Ilyobacter sp.]
MKVLKTEKLSKNFNDIKVLEEINLYVNKGEFVSVIGPSGCGKSTLFKLITGLIKEYEGEVFVEGTESRSYKSPIAYMPQKDLLLPWRTLYENASLPLEVSRKSRESFKERIMPLIKEFGLEGFEDCYPGELSGGMRQRGALLRTFLIESDLMLLDEPFGALDAITRMDMQEWLLEIWRKHNHSILFITHDIDEALFLSDRLYVMTGRPGSIDLEIKVNEPRPRRREVLFGEKYMEHKRNILKVLKK